MIEVKGHYIWDFWMGREENFANRAAFNSLKDKWKKAHAKAENVKNEDVLCVSGETLRRLKDSETACKSEVRAAFEKYGNK
ncbi:MAG: hypothetical protein K2N72_05745 [Oscillospiraceae bacterium]|nr:hypothetical protein [Oscillospiraceae bacterium]